MSTLLNKSILDIYDDRIKLLDKNPSDLFDPKRYWRKWDSEDKLWKTNELFRPKTNPEFYKLINSQWESAKNELINLGNRATQVLKILYGPSNYLYHDVKLRQHLIT